MADEFRTIHIVQACLQAINMPWNQIVDFLCAFEDSAASPESFARWNQNLDSEGMKILGLLLQPSGVPLAIKFLNGLFDSWAEKNPQGKAMVVEELRKQILSLTALN